MDTLDNNIFTDCICRLLTGKNIDNILLVNKQYNAIVKADMKHLYKLFWTITEMSLNGKIVHKSSLKDRKLEGEQLRWYTNGQLSSKEFYKGGKKEGEQLRWWNNGQLEHKEFYKEGKLEGERFDWYINGNLCSKRFYNNGKFERVMN